MNGFLLSVLEDITANMVTLLLGASVFSLWVFFRFSSFEQRFRHWIHPEKRVLLPSVIEIDVVTHQPTPFLNPLEPHERARIIQFYSRRAKATPHNEKVIRLDSLNPCKVSIVDFFDFLSTNLIVFPANAPIRSFYNQLRIAWDWIRIYPLVRKVFLTVGHPSQFDEVLSHTHLANIVAVSVLLIDSTGRIGIVARSNQVAISSGQFATSSAGTVSEIDLDADNPFIACAIREISEELNLNISTLKFDGIVIPKQKMQPIFLYSAKLSRTWEELWPLIRRARDFSKETKAFYAVPPDKIIDLIITRNFTDTAAFQLFKYANERYPQQRYWKALSGFRRFQIQHYRLGR
jgi:8-oxo-dGTP pyrophosphatase MutT (NUDIX family)